MPLFASYQDFRRLEAKVDLALTLLRLSLNLEKHMSKAFDDLAAEIAQDEAVMSSALKLIDDLAVQIANAGTNPDLLHQLTTDLMSSRQSLASAIAANTVADAAPVDVPPAAPTGDELPPAASTEPDLNPPAAPDTAQSPAPAV